MLPFVWITLGAIVLMGFASFQLTSSSIGIVRRRTALRSRRDETLRELRHSAEVARLKAEIQSDTRDTLGWRVVEVAEIVDESRDCRSFYFVDPSGQQLPDFQPGQYLMVRPALAGAYQATRCYSLSSSPNSRFWRITVKRQEPDRSDTKPNKNGGLSCWLHDTINVGDCLLVGGPSGQFHLDKENSSPLVLLAAGVGITPMASMLRWALEHTPDREVRLLYQVKDLEHWPLGRTLHNWQAKFKNIQLHTFASRVEPATLRDQTADSSGGFYSGRFSAEQVLKFSPAGCDYFMCGPDPWMESIREGLLQADIPPEHIHWESFGGTGNQPAIPSRSTDAEPVAVRFDFSDQETNWSDPEQSLWELARESGVEIPSGCLSGVCGCCRVKLLQGEVEYDREISVDLDANECLTCVARPKSACVLDV